eukprot:9913320-Heterocapsa_arctica.AAC.1
MGWRGAAARLCRRAAGAAGDERLAACRLAVSDPPRVTRRCSARLRAFFWGRARRVPPWFSPAASCDS